MRLALLTSNRQVRIEWLIPQESLDEQIARVQEKLKKIRLQNQNSEDIDWLIERLADLFILRQKNKN